MIREITDNKVFYSLPYMPCSVNKAYAGYPKRHKSNEYKRFQKRIQDDFRGLDDNITGDEWLQVKYIFYFPIYNKSGTKKIKDIANYEKCLTDTLCEIIPGFEDHKILRLEIEKKDSEKEYMEIIIQEIKEL